MTFRTSVNAGLGVPNFNVKDVDVTPKCAIGTIVKAFDPVLGEGEFIYLLGVANTVAGDAVVYDLLPSGPATVRLAKDQQSNSGRAVAFALVAVPAGSYGWYQVGGCAVVNTVAGTVAGVMMSTATTGSVGNTADAGDQIIGARISSAVGTPAANQSYATLQRPVMQSQIT